MVQIYVKVVRYAKLSEQIQLKYSPFLISGKQQHVNTKKSWMGTKYSFSFWMIARPSPKNISRWTSSIKGFLLGVLILLGTQLYRSSNQSTKQSSPPPYQPQPLPKFWHNEATFTTLAWPKQSNHALVWNADILDCLKMKIKCHRNNLSPHLSDFISWRRDEGI